MENNYNLHLICILIVFSGSIWTTHAQDCECIALERCLPFMRLLRFDNTPKTRREIISNICEARGNLVKVCCPNNKFAKKNFFPTTCSRSVMADKVVGGLETHIGEFPWMAALGYKVKSESSGISFHCAGSIINSRYVLTAAHCVHSNFTKMLELHTVRLGEWDFSSVEDCLPPNRFSNNTCAPPTIDLAIEETIIHPKFNQAIDLANDIAIIRLNQTIDFDGSKGFLEPICFPSLGLNAEFEANGDKVLAIGWGFTENRTPSSDMLKVYLSFADVERCRNIYPSRFTDFQLCVGGQVGMDTCMGDSGGPLMLTGTGERFSLIGIVSYGEKNCRGSFPAVYTSVSEYRDWIEGVMKPW